MALQWVNPKSASYCCTPARHVPWSPQRCMARGRGEGRLWDMTDKGSRALHGLGEQFLPDTQMSPTCWHSCQPWVHEWGWSWLMDVDPFGLRNTLATRAVWPISHANSSLVMVPCPLSPPCWLQPSTAATGKSCGVCDRGGNMSQISHSLQSSVPHKNLCRIYRKMQQGFNTGNVLETEIQQLLYQMEHWANQCWC